MQEWELLMSMPKVLTRLQPERSSVLLSLLHLTERIRDEFESRIGSIDSIQGMEAIP